MASSSGAPHLPAVLANTWRYDQNDVHKSENSLTEWTVSSLAEAHLKAQLADYEMLMGQEQRQVKNYLKAPSLTSLSAGKIIEMLEDSDNLVADVRTLAKSLNTTTLREVLEDPRTSYLVLRAFLALPPSYGPANAAETARTLVDIDKAIITNEKYIRSRGAENNRDGKGLVTLDHASILFAAPISAGDNQPLTIERKTPPKGGFEILDEKRARSLEIQPSSKAFAQTFHRITRGILDGLDWSNVLVAGGIALTTLMHTNPSRDHHKDIMDNDLDIYIHGLGPKEANDKVRHIFEVWKSNLPADNKQQLVVKNSKTIVFLADYPNRRIQIILKLIQSPTQVLLNFDLDPCAIGFNGKDALMLPRCARAIETGYSTFTMDLIWGHHLGDRRATQEIRVFKYANRGFGLRILPSYIRSVEESDNRQLLEAGFPVNDIDGHSHVEERNRKPNGTEPGLKTLKRIAYLGQNFVHSYYFGVTPLSKCPPYHDQETWDEDLAQMKAAIETTKVENKRLRAAGQEVEVPHIALNNMDTRDIHAGLPGGRRGLGGFELFMRHCEAWRLDACGEAVLDLQSFSSTVYDVNDYDDMPEYTWDKSFSTDRFAEKIEQHNNKLFDNLKVAICQHLHTPYQRTGWRDYLTRRIRRQVQSSDIDTIFEKQITMPLIIPYDLEQFINQLVSDALSDAGLSDGQSEQVLIPVHEQGKGTAILSDIQDTAGQSGNVRFWVMGNELMWAGIDRRIDEVFEVLWSLFHWHNLATYYELDVRLDQPEALYHIARGFRHRLPPALYISTNKGSEQANDTQAEATNPSYSRASSRTVPSPREAVLFKRWAFHSPPSVNRHYNDYSLNSLFNDEDEVLYPFPDELFWKDGDEGDYDIEGVPQWHDTRLPQNEDVDRHMEEEEEEEGRKRKRESSSLSQNLVTH